jgi:hypothetical protein
LLRVLALLARSGFESPQRVSAAFDVRCGRSKSFVAFDQYARDARKLGWCIALGVALCACPSGSSDRGGQMGAAATGAPGVGGLGSSVGSGGTTGAGGVVSPIATGSGGTQGGTGGVAGGAGGALGGAGGLGGGTGGMLGAMGGMSGGTGGMSAGTGGSGMVDPKCGSKAHCQSANGMMVCVDNSTSMPPTCTSGGNECTTALPGSACAALPTGGMGCVLGCGMAMANQCPGGLTCQNPFGMGSFCATSGGMPPTCIMASGSTDCAMYSGTVCTTVSILTGCFKTCTM